MIKTCIISHKENRTEKETIKELKGKGEGKEDKARAKENKGPSKRKEKGERSDGAIQIGYNPQRGKF